MDNYLIKNVLFLAACKTQVSTHCFAINVPIASYCKIKGKEHEREVLCAEAFCLFEFELVSPHANSLIQALQLLKAEARVRLFLLSIVKQETNASSC